jgi:signal transduction histidine kinase
MNTLENENEKVRVKALMEVDIMDTLPEKMFDDLAKIASSICNTPISIINFIDSERQFFKSNLGLGDDEPAPLEHSFCAHAIADPQSHFQVTDARLNPLFASNPFVTGDPKFVFYYGIPLVTTEGFALGTFCVIDYKPGKLTQSQIEAMQSLANQVMLLLDLRKKNILLEKFQLQLENYSKSMEQFAYMAAHDLKEPIRNITSFTNLLMAKNKAIWDDTDKKYLNFIKSSTKRMNQLIADLMDYAKGSMAVSDIEKVNVKDLIESIFNSLTDNIEIYRPQLILDTIPTLTVSKTALSIIFQNIIGNALKYRHENKVPEIKIIFEENRLYWTFSVEDNGIGIEEKYLETIFEPFKRLHLQKEFDGSGLGLASCRKIIEKHQGKIWATSELNKGTTIHFSLKK